MNEMEADIIAFLEECEGIRQVEEAKNPVTKVEFLPYGDMVHYKDGTTYYRSIGD